MIGASVVAALVGSIFFINDDSDGDEHSDPQPEPAPEPGPEPQLHEGTDGADEITSYDPEADEDGTLSSLDGDDTIRFEEGEEIEWNIDSGAGNDEIDIGYSYRNEIHGGDGNDHIQMIDGADTEIHGDAGNDTISASDSEYYDFGNLSLFGGEGDDVLQVGKLEGVTQLEFDGADGPDLSGGEGSDSFDLSVELDEELISLADFYGNNDVGSTEGPSDEPRSNDIGRISDFVSGEDKLTIDPVTHAEAATYLGHDIVQSEDETSTGITLHYAVKGQTDPVLHATLWLDGTPSIAEGDLQFVNLPA
ncbi:hypothetical protein A7A09_013085 [Paracoccus methylarcula]|uniref:Calcium-binding protein n=2 Tax=Paracoccus methylarcula TaxID=72022 RepID=A0A3R7Q1Q3_9RHOB|nr:hypothetical protein A7A09_013085 [Paracoccus methylarcula]